MSDNAVLDSNIISDKEVIRKNIRLALANRASMQFSDIDLKAAVNEPISDPLRSFVLRYRACGGKYIMCTKANLISSLAKLIRGQNYFNILNTNYSLKHYLDNYKIRYADVISMDEPADAALVFSDMLIASNGSIGFMQSHTLYPSARNLAKDLIIISSTRFLYADIGQALEHRRRKYAKSVFPMTEFLCPSRPEEKDGTLLYTPLRPRFILMLVDEGVPCPQRGVHTAQQPTSPHADVPADVPQKEIPDKSASPDNSSSIF